MSLKTLFHRATVTAILVIATATAASAANMLANASFENPPVPGEVYGAGASWGVFGNIYLEPFPALPFPPNSGLQSVKMFGTFPGPSGVYQAFPAAPGSVWTISAHARMPSFDPMAGNGPPNFNSVVQKIVFFDAADVEIPGAVESTILNGTYPVDTWVASSPISGTAPVGTVTVRAFIIYVCPGVLGGTGQIDDISFTSDGATPTQATSWGRLKNLYR